ncbi:MAG: nucleotidyltransferase domain-containing protein [Verrucomicrobiota bacterium]|nr:nucleotidyltransferase domain-containing protein [Verrucomicrobiota bacterium]
MIFGLQPRDLEKIRNAISSFLEIEKALVFGSRAIGNYKKSSDVDIAILGDDIDDKIAVRLSGKLNEESPLPYFFDVLNYNPVSNEELIKHIDSFGKGIYKQREKT